MAVAAAADVIKILDAPGLGGVAVDNAEFGGARAAVDDLVIGHHHHLVGGGEAVDA